MNNNISFQVKELARKAREEKETEPMRALAKSLQEIGEPAVLTLIDLMNEGKYVLDGMAQCALANMGKPAIPALSKMAENEDAKLRQRAVSTLGSMCELLAFPLLVRALEDTDALTRGSAAWGLGYLAKENSENSELVQDIAERLAEASRTETYFGYHWKIIQAMGTAGHPAAVPELLRLFHGEKSWSTKMGVMSALMQIGGEEVMPTLECALRDDEKNIRIDALRNLAKIGKPAASLIIIALEDEEKNVRDFAREILLRIGFPRNPADLKLIHSIARKARKEGRPTEELLKIYNVWSDILRESRANFIEKKRMPKPPTPRPNKANRVQRLQRVRT